MNTKVTLSLIAAIVVLYVGYTFLRPTTTPVPTPAATTNLNATTSSSQPSAAAHTQPVFKFGTTTQTFVRSSASFDPNSLVSTSAYPTITGTANVPKVGIIVNDSKGVGIVGTSDIPVEQGHWSYPCSAALPSGTYTLLLVIDGKVTAAAQLSVTL